MRVQAGSGRRSGLAGGCMNSSGIVLCWNRSAGAGGWGCVPTGMDSRDIRHRIVNTEKTKNPRSSTEVFPGQHPCPLIGVTRRLHALRAKRNNHLLRGTPWILRVLRVENRQVKQHRRISLRTTFGPAPPFAALPFPHRKPKTRTARISPGIRQARRPGAGYND
jgi:hypothetical protein